MEIMRRAEVYICTVKELQWIAHIGLYILLNGLILNGFVQQKWEAGARA